MSAREGYLAGYLTMRRALGCKLGRAGRLLPRFVSFLEAADTPAVTAELAIAWARLPERARPRYWAQRLAIARGFAAYRQTVDPATEMPPSGVFPARRFRPAPYLWSEADVCRLVEQAGTLRPRLRAATHATLFGLLAATGGPARRSAWNATTSISRKASSRSATRSSTVSVWCRCTKR